MSRIYICQRYGGKFIYKLLAKAVHKTVSILYPDDVYISPILLFGHLYNIVDYETGIDYCLNELSTCDCMLTLGKYSNSKGCMIEKEYCKDNNIPIIDIDLSVLKVLTRGVKYE